MKNIQKWLSITFMLLFVGSVVLTYFYLFNFKDDAANALGITNINDLPKLEFLIGNIYQLILTQLILGLGGICMALLRSREDNRYKIIEVEKRVETRREKEENSKQQEVDQTISELAEADKKIEKIKQLAQTEKDKYQIAEKILGSLCGELDAVQGAVFAAYQPEDGKKTLRMVASYAHFRTSDKAIEYEIGEGLIGQAAKERRMLNISSVPEGYITILSGLGKSEPNQLIIFPIVSEDKVIAVLEVALFKTFGKPEEKIITATAEIFASKIESKELIFAEADQFYSSEI